MTHVFIFAVLHRSIQHLTMLFNISRYLRLLAIFIGLSNPVWASSLESSAFETSIQLNWKFQFEFAGPIAAKEKGFYAQQGLNVVLNEGGPDIDPVESVIKGRSHFGISGSSLIIDRYEGKPVVALATLLQNSAVGLLVRKSGLSQFLIYKENAWQLEKITWMKFRLIWHPGVSVQIVMR